MVTRSYMNTNTPLSFPQHKEKGGGSPMRTAISLLDIHLLLLLLLILIPPISSTGLIEQTCKKTPFYDLCISILKSDPQSLDSDLKGLAMEMANKVLSNASDNLDYIHDLIKQNKDPEQERPLAYCAEEYTPVVKYILPQAIEALSNGHYGFANYGISNAAKGADACQKNFSGSETSPLTERNNLVHNMSAIAVAIINLLLKKG